MPFGLDALTERRTTTTSIERSVRTIWRRDATSGQWCGRFFKRGLSHWAGVFRHDGDNATSRKVQGGDQMVAARLTGTFSAREAGRLHFT